MGRTRLRVDGHGPAVKPVFVAKCRAATGREIAGTIRSAWNQTDRDDSDLDSWQAGPGSTAVLLD